jgi:hypothetical protein
MMVDKESQQRKKSDNNQQNVMSRLLFDTSAEVFLAARVSTGAASNASQ